MPAERNRTDANQHRVFLRGIEGVYNLKQQLARLRAMPRVIHAEDRPFTGGPQTFSRHFIEPEDGLGQTLHLHLLEYAPGGRAQKHIHVNEAVIYVLDGRGYDVHDGVRYDWEAGDLVVVHNNCVHQHFNASADEPARALVMKAKPVHMLMGMFFQKQLEPPPREPVPGAAPHHPREDEERSVMPAAAPGGAS